MNIARSLLIALFAWQVSQAALADDPAGGAAKYLQMLERPRVQPAAELTELPAVEGLRKFHLWFNSEANERVPGYLLLPDAAQFKGRRPVVIALHGTGANKDNRLIASILLKAAKAGFIGVATYHKPSDENAGER